MISYNECTNGVMLILFFPYFIVYFYLGSIIISYFMFSLDTRPLLIFVTSQILV